MPQPRDRLIMSTEVVVQQNNTRPLYRKFVRDGVAGNYDVVLEMIRIIRNGVDYDKGLEVVAKQILIDSGLDSYSPAREQLQAVFDFVAAKVKYIQDLAGRIESLKDARQTLSDGWGDCDDHTVLNCSLLGCLGFEDVKIAMAKYAEDADSFAHVYCVCYVNGQRFILDTSLPHARFNEEIKAVEVKEIPVFADVKGYDGLSGAYTRARHHARRAARVAVRAIPNALNFLPFGFVASSAIATGASLVDQATIKTLSVPATASNINAELDKIITDLLASRIAYDLAKTQALSIAANLASVEVNGEQYAFDVARKSIKEKLDFISNFQEYAKARGIRIVYLDSTKMLIAGVALAGGTAYFLYRNYYHKRLS